MAVLNDWNEQTKKNLHLMVTDKCNRNCRYCCNKFYKTEDISVATEEEFEQAENVFLTGGEPFLYSNPNLIAKELKEKYPNIKKVYVYTNMFEFFSSNRDWDMSSIDGINFSIKNQFDYRAYLENRAFLETTLKSQKITENRLYCFPRFENTDYSKELFTKFDREWQEEFQAAPDSFFRRVQKFA